MCEEDGSVSSYHLLVVNRRVRNWNHLEHDSATRHGLKNVKEGKMRNHRTHWVTGVQRMELQLSVSRSNGNLSTGTFTRVQQLNITTREWKWRRNLAPLLPCCGAPESGLLKPALRPGLSQRPSVSLPPSPPDSARSSSHRHWGRR